MHLGAIHFRVQLAQGREVVEDPERPAVRGDHQIIVFDHQVVDGSGRQVQLERLPATAVVKRHEDADFRAGIEQALALGVLAHCVNVGAFRQSAGDFRP